MTVSTRTRKRSSLLQTVYPRAAAVGTRARTRTRTRAVTAAAAQVAVPSSLSTRPVKRRRVSAAASVATTSSSSSSGRGGGRCAATRGGTYPCASSSSTGRVERCVREKMLNLLDLSEDLLINIISHVMSPAKEGHRKIVTEEAIRSSLPFAMTCWTIHGIWKRSLHDLEIWVSGSLDDRGLLSLCKGNGQHIHRLGLRKCHRLSRNVLQLVPSLCPNLRSIDVSHVKVPDTAIIDLACRSGTALQFLAMHACETLTERAFTAIAANCPNLRFLDVGRIPAVNDHIVQTLVSNLGHSLRTLVLSACTQLSDSGMRAIAEHCTSLMSLTLRSLPLITDAGLQELCKGIGERVQILDVLDCTGLTLGGYFTTMELYCPHVFRYLEESNYIDHLGERCLRDNIIATMPGLIYRISATDAFRRRPALYFLLLDESTLRPFRVSVQSKSLNLSDFGTVLISNFGKRPTLHTKNVLLERFGYDSPPDDVESGCQSD